MVDCTAPRHTQNKKRAGRGNRPAAPRAVVSEEVRAFEAMAMTGMLNNPVAESIAPTRLKVVSHLRPDGVFGKAVHKQGVWNLGLARTPRFLHNDVGFQTVQTPFLWQSRSGMAAAMRWASSAGRTPCSICSRFAGTGTS